MRKGNVMQGRILIVDAIATNRIVLKVKLASVHYEVLQAASLADAFRIVREQTPDLVITALHLPDGNAARLCTTMKRHADVAHIPVMAVGCRADAEARMATLEAGVQEVLMKPLDDTILLGRIRSLIRAHNAAAEWRMRDDTSRALGLAEQPAVFAPEGRIVMVIDDAARGHAWTHRLRGLLRGRITATAPADALRSADTEHLPDIFVLVLPPDPLEASAMLRLIPAIRANADIRHAGLMVLQTAPDATLSASALDLGADDLMTEGFDAAEMALRLKLLMHRKRMADQMRATVRTGLRAAVFDPLTGLHNRRYAMPHLSRIAEHASQGGRSFAVMLADMDHFKRINDRYGHASGDAVLTEAAQRLRGSLRAMDLVARIGGEEFLIVMPGTDLDAARATARRLCSEIGGTPFAVPGASDPIDVTISIGLYHHDPAHALYHAQAEELVDLADKALYEAKLDGRNRVTLSRPAA
jgi:two-component system cell cycle response regulator